MKSVFILLFALFFASQAVAGEVVAYQVDQAA